MGVSVMTVLGIVMALALITVVGIRAGKRVQSGRDFTKGNNMSAPLIAGSLVGTLVGGSSTIGTAQLAFHYGFSAWWFTLGGGIGLTIMACFFVKPLYNSGLFTIPQILGREYGRKFATTAAILMMAGTFIAVISQMVSGTALITSLYPVSPVAAVVLIVVLMSVYVVFGGIWGTGMVGIVKTILLYVATFVCGIVSLKLGGGLEAFREALPAEQYFNLFARGYWKDGGAGASLIFGVVTTQAYLLPIVSAKNLKVSRAGVLLGGALTVVIGLAGIFVGMFMRLRHPDMNAAAALPQFVLTYLPDFVGGVILAALLIALVGSGAGMSLSVSAILCNDIYKPLLRPQASEKEQLLFSRGMILALLSLAAVIGLGEMGTLILTWSFLSMALRGAVAFSPLCFALFWPGRLPSRFAFGAIIAGPLLVLTGSFILPEDIDPLFLGIAGALAICIAGWLWGRKRKEEPFQDIA